VTIRQNEIDVYNIAVIFFMVIDSKLYKPSAVLCKTSHLGKVNGQVLLLRPNAFSLSSTLTAAWWCQMLAGKSPIKMEVYSWENYQI